MATSELGPTTNCSSTTQLSPLYHYGPVTFIKIHNRYIFVGYGPILHIYQVDSSASSRRHNNSNNKSNVHLIFKRQVFKRNKIHHVSINSAARKIIISGGRSFTVLPLDTVLADAHGGQSECNFTEMAINEWIITSEILDDGTVLLLNSYNVVYKITPLSSDTNQRQHYSVEKISCGEKSILYSGSINVVASSGEIYIAAGTVMNGVIVWDLTTRLILYGLNDHEGSIFGVKIDLWGKYLISCSDDRSIKLYDLQRGGGGGGEVVATGWGHGSRIWNLEFANASPSEGNGGLQIMSIGEDCTLRIWKYNNESDVLQPVKVIENCHRGKHVWSGDIDLLDLQLCCTGGADGRVRLHDLQRENQVTIKLTLHDFAKQLLHMESGVSFNPKDCIRDYFELINLNKLVCLTSNGYVIEYDYESKCCTVVYQNDKLAGFGIVDGFNDLNLVVVADRSGKLTNIQYGKENNNPNVSQIESHDEAMKITNLLTSSTNGRYFVLIESPNVKIPLILHEVNVAVNGCDGSVDIAQTWNIPKPQSNFPTTAMTIDTFNNWIIFASKRMSLYFVDLNNFCHHLTLHKIASGDTVSSVSVLNAKQGSLQLLVLARDGVYLIIKITTQPANGHFQFEIMHENKLTRGFIEGGFFHKLDLILYGFKSSFFYIWNETRQIEIMNEFCGGNGHRHFKFYRKNLSNFSFIYLFKNDIYVCHYKGWFIKDDNNDCVDDDDDDDFDFGLVHGGTHGREIRAIAIQKNGQLLPDGSRLIITSAEDSTIGLSKLLPSGKIHNYWNMTNHISGMQAVGFLGCDYAFSCAANEEFIVWKLDWLTLAPSTSTSTSTSTNTTITASPPIPTLREQARLKSNQDVPDLRVMDFDAVGYNDYIFIVTVFSNSMIKLWRFEKEPLTVGLNLIHEWNYSTCCILHCQLFQMSAAHGNEKRQFLLIATTDGNITVYDISTPTSPVALCLSKLHQSGIKAICLIHKDGAVYLLTGGDDNALVVSRITILEDDNNLSQLILQTISREPNAASATITSISHVSDDDLVVVVVSVDQMIRLWSFTNDELHCLAARYTTVADTGCCDVTTLGDDKHMIVVGGAGLSTWEITMPERN